MKLPSLQARAYEWAVACFGQAHTDDRDVRALRVLEEVLELAQAAGCDERTARRVLEYVYGRPAGVVSQEVGGTLITLAVFCEAYALDMEGCGEAEYDGRILARIEKIRERNATKPSFAEPATGES